MDMSWEVDVADRPLISILRAGVVTSQVVGVA